jgi:sucrose phosphorylase
VEALFDRWNASLATGSAGYLTRWAASLKLPSDRVTFFNFLASHDGIGINAARGILSEAEITALAKRALAHGGFVSCKHNSDGSQSPYELNINFFDALSNPNDAEPVETQVDRFLVAHAIMLALAGVPGIYFHSLFGSRNDRAGAEASGIPRRINRQKLTRAGLEHDPADPASLRARVFAGVRQLLQARRGHAAFHPLGRQEVLAVDERVFAIMRVPPDESGRMLCLHNVSNTAVTANVALPPGHRANGWRPLWGEDATITQESGALRCRLGPYQAAWLRAE